MNGIIKGEFNLYDSNESFEQTYERIVKSITAYNEIRPHGSCDNLAPCQAHKKEGELKKRWKNYSKQKFETLVPGSIEEVGQLPPQSKPRFLFTANKNKELPSNIDHV